MDARLIATEGPLKGSAFPLPEGEFNVGRSATNDLFLRDAAVSREHCVFRNNGARITLIDAGSHNGTFVNDEQVSEQELHNGDLIRIGTTVLQVAVGPGEGGELQPPSSSTLNTIQMRVEDSAYLSDIEMTRGAAPSARATQDMRLLLRLSTMLYSFKALYGAQGQSGLSQHLMSLLMDIIPTEAGGVLTRSANPKNPYIVLAESPKPLAVNVELFQRVSTEGVAVVLKPEHEKAAGIIATPVMVRGDVEAVLYFTSAPGKGGFDEGHLQLLTAVAGMAGVAWENASMIEWLFQENERLRQELNLEHDMIGESTKMLELQRQIARVAPSSSTVLILGESGTGKELIARAVHRNSGRSAGPFVAINCAALTDTLLESELFGYEKGAFTGALTQRKGKLEVAEGGTVFLDEIGELSPMLQAKLLRVLQERELQRVGGTQNIKLDIRLVAATNRDLGEMVKKGAFRQDLYYRLNVVTLKASPLRQRPEDVVPLAEHFAKKFAGQVGRKLTGISTQAKTYLRAYSWPGNVRELENAIERAVVLGTEETILPEDLPENIREERPAEVSATLYEEAVEAAKRQVVMRAFDQAKYDHETAAKLLGLHPNYLHRLIRTLDMRAVLKSAARGH
jgi:Nif-specific regulatory protein